MSKIVELEKQLMQRNKELDVVRVSVGVTAGLGRALRGWWSLESIRVVGMHGGGLFGGTVSEVMLSSPHGYGLYAHVCAVRCWGFSPAFPQVWGATVFSHLHESELILWITRLGRK